MRDCLVLKTRGNFDHDFWWLRDWMEVLPLPAFRVQSFGKIDLHSMHMENLSLGEGLFLDLSINGCCHCVVYDEDVELTLPNLVTFALEFDPQSSGLRFEPFEGDVIHKFEVESGPVPRSYQGYVPKPFQIEVKIHPIHEVIDEAVRLSEPIWDAHGFLWNHLLPYRGQIKKQIQDVAREIVSDFMQKFPCEVLEAEGCFAELAFSRPGSEAVRAGPQGSEAKVESLESREARDLASTSGHEQAVHADSDEPWTKVENIGWDRKAAEMWYHGGSAGEIAKRVGAQPNTVTNKICLLRKRYGTAVVPYHRRK